MQKRKRMRNICTGLLAGYLLFTGLLPRELFDGCIRVVVPKEQQEVLPEEISGEDLKKLFDLSKSDIKIVLKFRQKD